MEKSINADQASRAGYKVIGLWVSNQLEETEALVTFVMIESPWRIALLKALSEKKC